MRRVSCCRGIALLGLLTATAGAAGETCRLPPNLPVSLVILQNGRKVQELAQSVRDARVVRRDANTVVFDDGRVITSDVASAGDHLNELGWGSRRIDVAVSFPRRRALPKGSYG